MKSKTKLVRRHHSASAAHDNWANTKLARQIKVLQQGGEVTMNRITALSLLVLLEMAAIMIVLGPKAAAEPDGGPAVSGRGQITIHFELETFSFDAVTRQDGSVTGQAKFLNRDTGVQEHIAINCLSVLGNTAYISGTITMSGYPKHIGQTRSFIVEDNGEKADDSSDKILLLPANSGFDCNNIPTDQLLWLVPIEAGKIQVR